MPMMDSPDLSRIRWRTVRLVLQNSRHACAREHPLAIFDAIFKFAARAGAVPDGTDWFFHPLAPLEPVIHAQALYELELVFPQATDAVCRSFVDGVRRWLDDPAHNFHLRDAGDVRERCLDAVWQEQAHTLSIDNAEDELCLDFLTPLSIKPVTQRTLAAFGGQALFRLAANRLRRWYGEEADRALEPLRPVFTAARVLPWFWDYVEFRHKAKSRSGEQYICGMQGPLYVRGALDALLPVLLILQELHLGPRKAAGQGAFRLYRHRPCLDRHLDELAWYENAFDQCQRDTDLPFCPDGADRDVHLRQLRDRCASGQWAHGSARLFLPPRGSFPSRPVAVLPPDDLLAQTAVRTMLADPVRKALPAHVPGWRPGKKARDIPALLRKAALEGRPCCVRAIIADVFAHIPLQALRERLDAFLPRADSTMRQFLYDAVTMPVQGHDGEPPQTPGLLPDSPLAPLLADIYLQPLDQALATGGVPCIRHGDTFLLPVATTHDAPPALSRLEENLAALGLGLDPARTKVAHLSSDGTDPDVEEDSVLPPAGRRPLYVQQAGAFVGMDGDSVLVRRGEDILGKAPLHTVSGIFLHGAGAVSSRLVQRCVQEELPLTFCSPAGWQYGTLFPCSRTWYGRIGRHAARHAALSPQERDRAARSLVMAKIQGAHSWLLPRLADKAPLRAALERAALSLDGASGSRAIMGVEGALARVVFPLVNGLVRGEAFRSERRLPRTGTDRWNTLLDAAYSLLFARLQALVQAAGLDPWLGFLHSPGDRYPSLVADMQEPFRHRIDQMLVRLVNQNALRPEHLRRDPARWRLEKAGHAILIRHFECLLDTRFAGEDLSVREGMLRQLNRVRGWAHGEGPLRLQPVPCRRDEDDAEAEGSYAHGGGHVSRCL